MADVRAMLRAERASRAPPKSSKQAPPLPATNKKRKADSDDIETRKRTKAEEANGLPAEFFDDNQTLAEEEENDTSDEGTITATIPGFVPAKEEDPVVLATKQLHDAAGTPPPSIQDVKSAQTNGSDVNEDEEWASFQQFANDIANQPVSSDTKPGAVLEAAPVTADELAAQAQEEQKSRRELQQEELEAEKEDAARNLEDEFEAMEDLEARVRNLKEKRERLRRASLAEVDIAKPAPVIERAFVTGEQSDDSDDDVDEFDGWRFGSS